MTDRKITIDLKNMVIVAKPITAKKYYDITQESIQIFENHYYTSVLHLLLKYKAPDFDHARLYAALKTLFGESTTLYDNNKSSFGYPFLLKITRNDEESEYTLNFTDVKGGIRFLFHKILRTSVERETHKKRDILHEPLEDDFSKDEMEYFMADFLFYIVGFMKSFEGYYSETFARSIDYCHVIYGFKEKKFFLEQYENSDEFCAATSHLFKSGVIPFNQVKPNL